MVDNPLRRAYTLWQQPIAVEATKRASTRSDTAVQRAGIGESPVRTATQNGPRSRRVKGDGSCPVSLAGAATVIQAKGIAVWPPCLRRVRLAASIPLHHRRGSCDGVRPNRGGTTGVTALVPNRGRAISFPSGPPVPPRPEWMEAERKEDAMPAP